MASQRTERHCIALLLGAAFLGRAQGPLRVGQFDVGVVVCVVQVDVALLLVEQVGVEERVLVVKVLRSLLQHRCHTVLLIQGAHGHICSTDLVLNVVEALVAAQLARQARFLALVVLDLGLRDEGRGCVGDED